MPGAPVAASPVAGLVKAAEGPPTAKRGTPATQRGTGDLHALGQQSWILGRSITRYAA
jgi:hypothetical protein